MSQELASREVDRRLLAVCHVLLRQVRREYERLGDLPRCEDVFEALAYAATSQLNRLREEEDVWAVQNPLPH